MTTRLKVDARLAALYDVLAIARDIESSRPRAAAPMERLRERVAELSNDSGESMFSPAFSTSVRFPLLWCLKRTDDTGAVHDCAVDLDPDSHRYLCLVQYPAGAEPLSVLRRASTAEIAHVREAQSQWNRALSGTRATPLKRQSAQERPSVHSVAAAGLTRFWVGWEAWSLRSERERMPFQCWYAIGAAGVGEHQGREWTRVEAAIDAPDEETLWQGIGVYFPRLTPHFCERRPADFRPDAEGPHQDFEGRTSLDMHQSG